MLAERNLTSSPDFETLKPQTTETGTGTLTNQAVTWGRMLGAVCEGFKYLVFMCSYLIFVTSFICLLLLQNKDVKINSGCLCILKKSYIYGGEKISFP